MSRNYDNCVQHHVSSGGRSLKVAEDHGAPIAVDRLHREVDVAYKRWLRRRGLMDEDLQSRYETQMAKARKAKAARRACR